VTGGRLRPAGRTPFVLVALAGAAALAISSVPPDSRAFTIRLVILAAGVVAAWRVLGRFAAVTASSPERFEAGLARPRMAPTEVSSLRSVETDLRMSAASAFGLEFRLKPLLRELARWRLLRNHGTDMDLAPEAARRILGDPLWQLMRPAEEFPEFRSPGAGLAEVRAGLDRLERI
jgi:hypothetical protein